ncbi:ATP12 family chaperone protein [Hirschia maritima]|uniref:ATP12 family chaperone protein n=1 Tax=Hirschia maritima TaxID=1121961 RepID=UPI00036C6E92|nr:ATP12 family protein [Hirschia maritima]
MSDFGSTDQRMKKFYKQAGIEKLEDGNWTIVLDGRQLKTPAKNVLTLPSEELAEAVAGEWADQIEYIDVATMHITRLVNVAIDRTPLARDEMAAEVARYAETDLVSHLAEGPTVLRERQEAGWAPIRDWAAQELDVFLLPVEGVMASPQPTTSLEAARSHAAKLDDMRLTGLNFGLGLFGSAVLALAVEQGRIMSEEAFDLSRIDEVFQAEQWGEDDEAKQREAYNRHQALGLGVFFAALNR